MVSIVTEAWVLAGCGLASKAATQELPVQQQHRPSAAAAAAGGGKTKKKTVMFRCVSSGGGQDHQREAAAVGRRRGLASCALAAVAVAASLSVRPAWALVLEDDEDTELLERVKEDRKKRLQKQGVISSSGTETGYLQDLIYKLSRVGQAIDRDDLPAASGVLGPSSDAPWVRNINAAFSKFSSSPEERDVADSFNTSLASLFTSVSKLDAESSKSAFVSSATALEKWIALAGLGGQLKGY